MSRSFWTEIFAISAGIGVVVSSAITLMVSLHLIVATINETCISADPDTLLLPAQIFFPRSAENEYAVKQASLQNRSRSTRITQFNGLRSQNTIQSPTSMKSPMSFSSEMPFAHEEGDRDSDSPALSQKIPMDIEGYVAPVSTQFSPNRRLASGAILQGGVTVMGVTARDLARYNSQVNPLVSHFRSPIGK